MEPRPGGFAKRWKRLQGGPPFLSGYLLPLSVRNTKFNKQKIGPGSLFSTLFFFFFEGKRLSPGTQVRVCLCSELRRGEIEWSAGWWPCTRLRRGEASRHPAELSRVRTGAASLSKRATMSVDGSQKQSSKPGVDFRLELSVS